MPDESEKPVMPEHVSGTRLVLTPNHSRTDRPRENRDESVQNFLGGPPLSVFLRLLMASLIVGFFMVWLDVHPLDVFRSLEHFFRHLWEMGFQALNEVGQYVLAGAVLVIPLWVLGRLLKIGR